MNIETIISDLELSLGSHAKCVLQSLSYDKIENEEDTINNKIEEFENDLFRIASFYANINNLSYNGNIFKLSENFINSQINDSDNAKYNELVFTVDNEQTNKCNAMSEIKEQDTNHKILNEIIKQSDKQFRCIRKKSIKRLARFRKLEKRRLIPFGRFRACSCNLMKSTDKAGSAYEVAAKCARLKRRLSQLFNLAKSSFAFSHKLTSVNDPLVSKLSQDLMRTRLQLAFSLRQRQNHAEEFKAICEDPKSMSDRFENLDYQPEYAIKSPMLKDLLEKLAEDITSLIIDLDNNAPDLSMCIDIPEPLNHQNRDDLLYLVRRSMIYFCSFYSKLVAPDDCSPILEQMDTSIDESISASEIECMLDAFDVFDSNVQNYNPLIKDGENNIAFNSSGSSIQDSSDCVSASSSPSNKQLSKPLCSDDLPKSPQASETSENDPEEGEILEEVDEFERSEISHALDMVETHSDIEHTEQAIMDEWAPMVGEKHQPKLPLATAVERALYEANKSCQRELHTIISLRSNHPEPQHIAKNSFYDGYNVPASVDRDIKGTASMVVPHRKYPSSCLRYSRPEMLRIRSKVLNSLQRQKQSKHANWKIFRRR